MKTFITFLLTLMLFSSLLNAQWREITLYAAGSRANYLFSSSNYDPDYNEGNLITNRKYGPDKLFDSDPRTTWVDGEKEKAHSEEIFALLPREPHTISIFAGYGKSKALFQKNNRPKTLNLTLYAAIPVGDTEIAAIYQALPFGESRKLALKDTFAFQRFPLPFSPEELEPLKKEAQKSFQENFSGEVFFILGIRVADYYKGSKWDDTCISEIHFNDVFIPDPYPEPNRKIIEIYTNDDENAILIDTPRQKKITLLRSDADIYQLMDNSADNHWAIFIFMPAEPPPGRVETQYRVFNTMLGRDVTADIEATIGAEFFNPSFSYQYPDLKEGLVLEYYLAGEDETRRIILKK